MSEWSVAGKTALVTGATGGIGYAIALALARQGASVILVGRNRARAETARHAIARESSGGSVELLCADFDSLAEVRALAQEFLASGRALQLLINNAGVMNTRRVLSRDGHEQMFAVNYLAHFLLTRLLLERMRESAQARIVHVASNAHAFCRGINFADPMHVSGFSAFAVYGHSKLASMLFSNELALRLRGSGLSSNALHPGAVATGIGTNNGLAGRLVPMLLKPFFRSPEKGAATAVYLASSAAVDGVSGKYFYNSQPVEPKPWARDHAAAGRLWALSEQLCGEFLEP